MCFPIFFSFYLLHPIIFDQKNTKIKQFYIYYNYSTIDWSGSSCLWKLFLSSVLSSTIDWMVWTFEYFCKKTCHHSSKSENYVQHSLLFVRINKWKEKRREKVKRKRLEEKFSPLAGDLLSVKGILTLLLSICILTLYDFIFE